jgi:hypothetical protein
MAKVFIGIALLFMLVTAGVGFLLKGNVDKLQSSLSGAKGKIAAAEAAAKMAKNDAEKAQKGEADAVAKAAAAEQTAATKTKEADDASTKLKEAQAVVDSSTAKVTDLQKQLDDMKGKPAVPNGPTAEDLAKVQTDLQNATKELAEQKQMNETLIAKGKDNEQKVADLTKEKNQRILGVAKAGLQGRILAVNSGWNFVVLSVGDKQGVMVNSSLIVVRGNDPIARLRITSVEPSTSIADVLPGTVRRGISVQPGDTVIFEGSRAAAPAPGAKAPDATIAAPLSPAAPLPNN